MYRLTVKALALLSGLIPVGDDANAGPGSPRTPQPVILSVMTDFGENRMVISGRYFGSATPTVRLARQVLPVKSYAKDQIVVSLPSGIQPATYGLTVTAAGASRVTSNVFSTALFAVN